MKNKIKFLVIFLVLAAVAFFIPAVAKASNVSCNFVYPQQVMVKGISYDCNWSKGYCNNDKAQQGYAECCANHSPYANCNVIGPGSISTDIAIDAWGTLGWGPCENQTATRAQLDAFCKSKGYAGLDKNTNVCFHEFYYNRWTWNGQIPMTQGANTGSGYALRRVICYRDVDSVPAVLPYLENWSCGAWSSCVGGQQARTCTDANNSGTLLRQPATSQSCTPTCTENWSCWGWNACVNGQQTRTCTDANHCGTISNRPIITKACDIACNATSSAAIAYGTTYQCNEPGFGYCQAGGSTASCCNASVGGDCMVVYPKRIMMQGPYDKKTLTVGESWDVGAGFTLTAMSIDAKILPRQVWLELSQTGGTKLDDKIIQPGQYYVYEERSYQGMSDYNTFGTYVDSVFAGATSDMVQLKKTYVNSLVLNGGCIETWSCDSWLSCVNNYQSRTCYDVNSCGTTVNKPLTSKPCSGLACKSISPTLESIFSYSLNDYQEYKCSSNGYNFCKVSSNVGRCCPSKNSLDSNCMVVWPARSILQGDGAGDKKILSAGESWNIFGGLNLKVESVDARSTPRQTWVTLSKNGVKLDDKVISSGSYYLYTPKSFQQYVDFNLFGVYADSIFSGATTDVLQLRYGYINTLWQSDLACSENWSCGSWSTCSNSLQTRTCTDANNCGTTTQKPAVSQSCTAPACTESWSCAVWSTCSGGLQTRTCTDANNCGTIVSKPATQQSCQNQCQESWSCGNWSSCQNGQQTKTCIDLNNCGTVNDKPPLGQVCSSEASQPESSPTATSTPISVNSLPTSSWSDEEKKLVSNIDNNLVKRLKGYILLQVENHGEAWYINPLSEKKFYLKDGAAAYVMLRKFGLGIKNNDLAKIPVGIETRFSDADSDNDGLADKLEQGLGTDPDNQDSDNDGNIDGDEIKNGTNPLGSGSLSFDTKLINRISGRILIQAESRGEAWYVNPKMASGII